MSQCPVSVIMPVFNAARYLADAIGSIQRQSFENFELIIIDDGSTDASLAVARQHADDDARIRVYAQPNQGTSRTYNRGMAVARAELVAIMDSDDIAMPNRLQRHVEYMAAHPECVVVSGATQLVCPEGVPLWTIHPPLGHDVIVEELLRGNGIALCQGGSMYRRKLALELGGYNPAYTMGEDLDLFLRMGRRGRLANVPDVVLKYRKHPAAITRTTAADPEKVAAAKAMMTLLWKDYGRTIPGDLPMWSWRARIPRKLLYLCFALNALAHVNLAAAARHIKRAASRR